MSMISVSRSYNSDAGLLAILGGRVLPVNALNCSDEGDRQFAQGVLSGMQMLATMQLTKTETALFASFTLLHNLPESQMHVEQIKTALVWQMSHRLCPCHAWVEYARLMNDILPFLKLLSEQHVECASKLQSINPALQLPQLYKELFVIEKR
ncbi:putative nuclear hormone receptor HR3-like protein [Aphelenchoides avenae]|nr:putative nuclear hormone receptor HR3-like protein [Aphelenchus avenae]